MCFDDRTRSALERIVGSLTTDLQLREDLAQEALVHLWRVENEKPGQTTSWYLQSCRFRVQHCLTSGKSVDSPKHRLNSLRYDGETEVEFLVGDIESDDDLLAEVSAHDMQSLLKQRLPATEGAILKYLAEGFTTREIGEKLTLSHQAVSKHRRTIKRVAVTLGIHPGPAMPPAYGSSHRNKRRASRCLPLSQFAEAVSA